MLWLTVDKNKSLPLFRQIFEQIKALILSGKIPSGDKLPSTRELASDLGVSRNVVLEAYDQLLAEGYIFSIKSSGTIVADGARLDNLIEARKPILQKSESDNKENRNIIDFRSGMPALDIFPLKTWGKLLQKICDESSPSILGYSQPQGRPELRQVLADYLFRTRGVKCDSGQIIITSGATQGLSLVSKLFYIPNAEILVEDPMNKGMKMIFSLAGYSLRPVPVDRYGIMTDKIDFNNRVSFVYVTPSHQYPLGGILPVQRRIELIKYARSTGCYIIEDDYDSEFRFEGSPVSTLHSLDPERVIYIGSFSKILAPALRLGYVILPEALIESCVTIKKYSDVHSPSLEQLALAIFITEGKMERYIIKLKKTYNQRRKTILTGLEANFPGSYTVWGESTGLHLTVEFTGIEFNDKLIEAALKAGVKVYPVEAHAIKKGSYMNRIIMGYGHLKTGEIVEGLRRLKKVISNGIKD